MKDKYIFLEKGDKLAAALHEKVEDFQEYIISSGIYSQWRKNQLYYENDFYGAGKSHDIVDAGAIGELKASSFNHFRNILRHMLNQLTAITPAFDVSAANTDVASRRAAKIGKDIVNYYFKVKRASRYTKRGAEFALVYGDGFPVCEWNPTLGKPITADEKGRTVHEGDFDFTTISPYDAFYDYSVDSKGELEWFIFRRKRNKYDLAKIFPRKAKRLVGLKPYYDEDLYKKRYDEQVDYGIDSDKIYTYSMYHKSNNILPNGKYMLYAGGGDDVFSLYEGDNLYVDKLPVFALSPSDYLDIPFGFTEANLLRGPQTIINLMITAMASNANALGTSNIWSPTGSNLDVQELTDGLNLITTDSDKKPEVLSLYQDVPGLKDLLMLCNSTMETLSGQNAVIRGNVQEAPNLKSGIAISTVINMAQQYSQALEKAYVEMFEDISTFMIDTLKKTASTERLIDVTGKMQATSVQSFTSEDLNGVSRVIVDQTNPITKQPAGKIEIAMELLKLGHITPEKFFDVVNTGNLDVAVESDERMLDFIAAAKEKLLDGGTIPPIPGINHQLYIKEIHSLLFDNEILDNPENQGIMQNIVTTIQQQLDILRNGDEIANLIYGGKSPTPMGVGPEEVNPNNMGPGEMPITTGQEMPQGQEGLPPIGAQ